MASLALENPFNFTLVDVTSITVYLIQAYICLTSADQISCSSECVQPQPTQNIIAREQWPIEVKTRGPVCLSTKTIALLPWPHPPQPKSPQGWWTSQKETIVDLAWSEGIEITSPEIERKNLWEESMPTIRPHPLPTTPTTHSPSLYRAPTYAQSWILLCYAVRLHQQSQPVHWSL